MTQASWQTGLVVIVALVVGIALGGSGLLGNVQAQSEGAAGSAICVAGTERNGILPIVLVDSREQSLLVYEYSYGNDQVELTAARHFHFDKQLQDWHTDGPSVQAVEQWVTRR